MDNLDINFTLSLPSSPPLPYPHPITAPPFSVLHTLLLFVVTFLFLHRLLIQIIPFFYTPSLHQSPAALVCFLLTGLHALTFTLLIQPASTAASSPLTTASTVLPAILYTFPPHRNKDPPLPQIVGQHQQHAFLNTSSVGHVRRVRLRILGYRTHLRRQSLLWQRTSCGRPYGSHHQPRGSFKPRSRCAGWKQLCLDHGR